jgi:AraC-like DNA-binding protein
MVLYQPFPMLAGRRAQAWRHQPAFRRPRHFHDEPEVNILLRGRCTMGIGERTVALGPGDVVFFQPGQDHALLDESADLDLFVLAVSPELADRVGAKVVKRTSVQHLGEGPRVALAEFLGATNALSDAAEANGALAHRFRNLTQTFESPHVLCRKTIDGLRRDMGQKEEMVARRLNVHPSALSRVFGQELGMKLATYRGRMRVIDFIRRVDEGQTMIAAALAAGFGSYSQCHRVFRATCGCSPREYFTGRREMLDAEVVAGLSAPA